MSNVIKIFQYLFCLFLTCNLASASTYIFTNAGVTGRDGPTQAQIDSNYSGTNLENNVSINTRGIQEWTVPVDGNYSIEALGASGGNGIVGTSGGTILNFGSGAHMKGNFELYQGDVLRIIVGQSGKSQTNNNGGGGGGGGGSFVVKNGNALIVAGGGGGAGGRTNQHGLNANITTSGNQTSDGTESGGQSGQGGPGDGSGWGAGGGGGFLSNGGNGGNSATGGLSFSNGSVGGAASSTYPSIGGFGGGGGVGYSGGGGGGYSGGAGGPNNSQYPGGGGGGSYNAGTGQNNSIRTDSGHGKVIITLLQPIQYIFTNAGATGSEGPTQAQIDSNYSATNLANTVTINTRGIQEWTVPSDGNYSIEVHGASGGDHLSYNNGGNGAIVTGNFNFSANEKLFIMVGQKGTNGNSTSRGNSSGGGGGTFVAKGSNLSASSPVIIAGGGGGGGDFNYRGTGQDGRSTENGGSTITGSTAGQNGNGGTNGGNTGAGNGAGYTGNGASSSTDSNNFPMSFINGGKGGVPNASGFAGGFGGGGHGRYGGGGGGGYSGGAQGDYTINDATGGGGGGSYNTGSDQNNSVGTNSGNGKVIISLLTPVSSSSFPPIITQGNSALTKAINEDTSVTWTASELNATDADTNASSLTWSLVTAPSHGTAIIDGNGSSPAILSFQPNANFNGSDSFSVQVSDGENNDSITINLTINSVNDNPIVHSINGQSLSNSLTAEIQVTENSSISLDINASDSIEGDTITFEKTGGTDRSMFDLNSSTGILSFSSAPDFENPTDADANNTYEIWFRANDGNGGFAEKRITIRVTNVIEDNDGDGTEDAYDPDDDNDGFSDAVEIAYGSDPMDANSTANAAPTDLNTTSALQVSENQSVGTVVGQLTATDPDANATLTFTLVSGENDNHLFSIDSNGTLRSASVFDFEANSSYTIRVKVRDQYNLSIKENFNVQITNIIEDLDGDGTEDHFDPDDDNDGFSDAVEIAYGSDPMDSNSTANASPTDLNATSALQVAENQSVGTFVGQLTATDPDANATLTFTLVGGSNDNDLFTIETNGTLRSASVFDFESNSSYTIRVKVRDQYYLSIKENFTVQITNIIEDLDGDGTEDHFDTDDDNDGFSDAVELVAGTDPRNPASLPNRPPSTLDLNGSSILESLPVGSLVGKLSATDPDANSTFTFSLVDGNGSDHNQNFSIDTNGTLRTTTVLDYESNVTAYHVRVRVTDEFNAALEGSFTISLLDALPPFVRTLETAGSNGQKITLLGETGTSSRLPLLSYGFQVGQSLLLSNSTIWNGTALTDSNFSTEIPLAGLQPETKYFFRSFTSNAEGTTYGTVQSFITPPLSTTTGPWWKSVPEIAGGWRTSPWLGNFLAYPQDWIYHADLGWLYTHSGSNSDLWLWSDEEGWLWTGPGIYPYLFQNSSANWLYFIKKKDGKTHFYDYTTKSIK